MRDSIASTWVLGIVMTFMVVMVGYVAIMLNYNKVFRVKTQAITLVEQYSGMNEKSVEAIDRLLRNNAYLVKGSCESDEYGVTDKTRSNKGSRKQSYCYKLDEAHGVYSFTFFYNFSLPMLGDLFTFRVTGDTNTISSNIRKDNFTYKK